VVAAVGHPGALVGGGVVGGAVVGGTVVGSGVGVGWPATTRSAIATHRAAHALSADVRAASRISRHHDSCRSA
jgi:hypothetical protein